MIQAILLDAQGFYLHPIVVEKLERNMTDVIPSTGYVKAQFVNGKWQEGATEKEIADLEEQIDICDEPTAEERITQLEADKEALAQNVYMLAEVLEALLGGEEDGQEESITEDTAS